MRHRQIKNAKTKQQIKRIQSLHQLIFLLKRFTTKSFSEIQGWIFHCKGTWGCGARKGMLVWTSSLAKGILLPALIWAKICFLTTLVRGNSNLLIPVKKTKFLAILVYGKAKTWQFLFKKTPIHVTLTWIILQRYNFHKNVSSQRHHCETMDSTPYPKLAERPPVQWNMAFEI